MSTAIDSLNYAKVPGWFRVYNTPHIGPYQLKRIMDIVGAILLTAISLPLLPLIVAVILFTSGRPVIFKQHRFIPAVSPFIMYKFRTMHRDSTRITLAGKILRPFRLDEIPQLWNVLRGEMSLVGSRPVPIFPEMNSVSKKCTRINCTTQILPGITGFAQVIAEWSSLPRDLGLIRRTQIDHIYWENCTLRNDLMILWRTIGVCLSRRGS